MSPTPRPAPRSTASAFIIKPVSASATLSAPKSCRLAFNLSTGADTGGAAIREIEAFRSPAGRALDLGWEVRGMVAATNYIAYQEDVPHSLSRLEALYNAADVIHLNHTLHGHLWYDKGREKPTILEHHGLHKGSFDIDFPGAIAQATRMGCIQIGSTANLELFGPITWAPIPYDLNALAKIRAQALAGARSKAGAFAQGHADDDVLTIAHAPTNRAVKSTEVFIAAVNQLIAVGLPVRPLLIEKKSHAECLQLKAKADIFVDQLTLGYGCNAIEAWGMGIPVIGGVTNHKWRRHMIARWGSMPLFEATEENLAKRITALVISQRLRQEFAELGLAHVRRWHTQAGHVKLMSEIYSSAKPTQSPAQQSLTHLTHADRLVLLRANRAELRRRNA